MTKTRRRDAKPRVESRLVAACFISGIGTWLTFLGIILFAQERFGLGAIPGALLVQSIPGMLFGKTFAGRVPAARTKQVFVGSQVVLAVCSVELAIFHGSLWELYGYLLASSTAKLLGGPLLNSLVAQAVDADKRASAYTRVGAATSVALAIAPAVGGALYKATGPVPLFLLDAGTYLVAAVICVRLRISVADQSGVTPRRPPLLHELRDLFRPPVGLPLLVRSVLRHWYLFGGIGALLNGLEFQSMAARHYQSFEVGVALGAWGAGNLIALLWPKLVSGSSALLVFAISVAVWPLLPPYTGWVVFLLAGLGYAVLSGHLRSEIQRELPQALQNVTWGYANQMVLTLNIAVYGAIAMLQGLAGAAALTIVLSVAAATYGTIGYWLDHRAAAEVPPGVAQAGGI